MVSPTSRTEYIIQEALAGWQADRVVPLVQDLRAKMSSTSLFAVPDRGVQAQLHAEAADRTLMPLFPRLFATSQISSR